MTKKDDRDKKTKVTTVPYPLPIPGMPPGMPQPQVPWPDDVPVPEPQLPEPPTESVPPSPVTGQPVDPHDKKKKR
jgi:hypothetical protein